MVKRINIKGYRGFGCDSKDIIFSIPNGNMYSGFNIIVGQNNSGKSTILECIKYFASSQELISFSETKRNKKNNDKVEILLETDANTTKQIQTVPYGGSEAKRNSRDGENIIFIPSRRNFNKNFGNNHWSLDAFKDSSQLINTSDRLVMYDEFTYLFNEINKIRTEFDRTIKNMIDFPNWTIDLNESSNYYVKVYKESSFHTSEGLGEGMISLMTMIGTLMLTKPGDTILIDEPELSLHPQVLKKVLQFLGEYSKNRQIIISTHSPYLVDISAVALGANIIRVVNELDTTKCYSLSRKSIDFFNSMIRNPRFPHSVGLESREIFFQSDNIIVVEGQEDVVGYSKFLKENRLSEFSFYGWGAGGSSNIIKVCAILRELGFYKVVGIFDGDKKEDYEMSKNEFSSYLMILISKDDIRDKYNESSGELKKSGLMDSDFNVKNENKQELLNIFNEIHEYFNR